MDSRGSGVVTIGAAYAPGARAASDKPPMTPELQKIIDGAKTEKVMLSNTNPLSSAPRKTSMRRKPGSSRVSASISISM